MKKVSLILSILLLFTVTSHAKPLSYGMLFGPSHSMYINLPNVTKQNFGLGVGGVIYMDYSFDQTFSSEISFMVSKKTISFGDVSVYDGNGYVEGTAIDSYTYIELPLLVKMSFLTDSFTFSILAGAALEIAVGSMSEIVIDGKVTDSWVYERPAKYYPGVLFGVQGAIPMGDQAILARLMYDHTLIHVEYEFSDGSIDYGLGNITLYFGYEF